MPENPYTRTVTTTLVEIVPDRGVLPDCTAWLANLAQCGYKARYLQDDYPVCGVHVGRPGLLFHPRVRQVVPMRARRNG